MANNKLVQHYGLSSLISELLIAGGFATPKLIRAASDEQLLGVLRAGQLATLKASRVYR